MRLDCHVHMVGNGLHGSGCSLRVTHWYHRFLVQFMLRGLGFPSSIVRENLEEYYIGRLRAWIADSSLDGVLLLALDHPYERSGTRIENFASLYVPNDVVLKLSAAHPELLPAVSVHPARPDAIDELERCAAAGAVAVKFLPNCQNINPCDPRYAAFWETMARLRLVLLAHTGGELSLPVYEETFADPELLRLPLECGVTTVAAHCGTSSLYWDRDYTLKFGKLLSEYPHLYGDNSGLLTPIRSRHFPHLLTAEFSSRVIHGSDLPIPNSALWPWLRRYISFDRYRALQATANPLERDAKIKEALGFPPESFTRLSQLISRARAGYVTAL